ncbi:MAG: hypothetical protein II326_04175 [Clostridia bacterium]|nr:hypothetical protein [Clostridia bacterium]
MLKICSQKKPEKAVFMADFVRKREFFHRKCEDCVKKQPKLSRQRAMLFLGRQGVACGASFRKKDAVHAICAEVSGKPIEKLKKSDIMRV